MGGPHPRAGEHGHGHLGNHGEEDPHHVPGTHAAVLQHVGQALRVAQEIGVGHIPLLALLPAPVVGHAVAPAGLHVAVETVVRGVQLAAGEPLVEGGLGVVQDLLEGLEPVEVGGLLGPPGLLIARGLLVQGLVRDQRVLHELLGRLEQLTLEQLAELALDLLRGGLGAAFHLPLLVVSPRHVLPERGGAHTAPPRRTGGQCGGRTAVAAVADRRRRSSAGELETGGALGTEPGLGAHIQLVEAALRRAPRGSEPCRASRR